MDVEPTPSTLRSLKTFGPSPNLRVSTGQAKPGLVGSLPFLSLIFSQDLPSSREISRERKPLASKTVPEITICPETRVPTTGESTVASGFVRSRSNWTRTEGPVRPFRSTARTSTVRRPSGMEEVFR